MFTVLHCVLLLLSLLCCCIPSQWSVPNGRTLLLPFMNKIGRGWWPFFRQNKPFFPVSSDQERGKWTIWRLVTSDVASAGYKVMAQGRAWEDSEVTVAWWEHQCSHPAVIWYHQYRVKPSSIFCLIPIINCLPHQEPGRIPKWIEASSDIIHIRSQTQTKNASRYFEQVGIEASVGSVIRLILLYFRKNIKRFFSRAKFLGFHLFVTSPHSY